MLKKVNFAHDEVLDTSDDEEPLFCDPNFEDVELEVVVAGPAFVGRRGLRIPTSVAGDLQECELVGLKSVLFVQTMWSHTLLASLGATVWQHGASFADFVLETDDLGVSRVRAVAKKQATRAPLTRLELAALVYDLKEAIAEFKPTPRAAARGVARGDARPRLGVAAGDDARLRLRAREPVDVHSLNRM